MRHFAILIAGGRPHSVVFLLTAPTPLDALLQYLRHEDSQLTFNDDGTVDDPHERIH